MEDIHRVMKSKLEKKLLKQNRLNIYKLRIELKIPDIFFPNISNFKVILGPLC